MKAWESFFTGVEENYCLFWWFPQKGLTDLSPVLSSSGFCDNTCCDLQLPFCWWPLSFVKFPVSPRPQTLMLPGFSVRPSSLTTLGSLLTHSVGYHLQTNTSQITLSNPALTLNIPIRRSIRPAALCYPRPLRICELMSFGPSSLPSLCSLFSRAPSWPCGQADRAGLSRFCLLSQCLQPTDHQFLSAFPLDISSLCLPIIITPCLGDCHPSCGLVQNVLMDLPALSLASLQSYFFKSLLQWFSQV